jgi:hypothetical protein
MYLPAGHADCRSAAVVLNRRDCGMRVQLSDSSLLDDLLAFLRSVGCVAYAIDRDQLDVVVLDSTSDRAARLELRAHLDEWRHGHSRARVVVAE